MSIRIVFAGTPEFGAVILEGLLADAEPNGSLREGGAAETLEICGVVSQPPRRSGRGLKTVPSPVARTARERELDLITPECWSKEAASFLREREPDYLVTAAYGVILPREALSLPRRCALNVHASLLPRWRGAAPVARAIEAGDRETGITFFRIVEGLDAGPVIERHRVLIGERETAGELTERLARLAAARLPGCLRRHFRGEAREEPQEERAAVWARKVEKGEGERNWEEAAETIDRLVRAFDPWPGVRMNGLRLYRVRPVAESGEAGTILSVRPAVVACGRGALLLEAVGRPGRRAMDGEAFLRGLRLRPGDSLKERRFS
ncbi:MAG: methionyl-tRNA formyltransferase [Candidatus Hydrogenedentota bacterium]|nr:MAG: methionyl-tRNA formyltransferase [Candidatus Hydrogenedentota bacterium]